MLHSFEKLSSRKQNFDSLRYELVGYPTIFFTERKYWHLFKINRQARLMECSVPDKKLENVTSRENWVNGAVIKFVDTSSK